MVDFLHHTNTDCWTVRSLTPAKCQQLRHPHPATQMLAQPCPSHQLVCIRCTHIPELFAATSDTKLTSRLTSLTKSPFLVHVVADRAVF